MSIHLMNTSFVRSGNFLKTFETKEEAGEGISVQWRTGGEGCRCKMWRMRMSIMLFVGRFYLHINLLISGK